MFSSFILYFIILLTLPSDNLKKKFFFTKPCRTAWIYCIQVITTCILQTFYQKNMLKKTLNFRINFVVKLYDIFKKNSCPNCLEYFFLIIWHLIIWYFCNSISAFKTRKKRWNLKVNYFFSKIKLVAFFGEVFHKFKNAKV